ncbi:hypothetical protein FWF48_02485 [Candidatus Saccharibacteria bacterium]|nr:hypothetical protein [Candidatus Saccharibacteria bacterium]
MDIKIIAGIIAVILPFIAYAPYLYNTWRGKTRPNPITWMVWSTTTAVLTAVLFTNGAGAMIWYEFAMLTLATTVVVLAFKNGGQRDIKRVDIICFIAAMAALICWAFVKQSEIAATLITFAGVLGAIATMRKAWFKPGEETLSMWVIQIFTMIFCIIATTSYNYVTLLDHSINIITNGIIATIIISRCKALLANS